MKSSGNRHKKGQNMSDISMKLMEYAIWILVAVVVIWIGIYGSRYAYDMGYKIFDRKPRNVESELLSVTIAEGKSVSEIAEALENAGLIDSSLVFQLQGILYNLKIKPGTYDIDTTISSLDLFERLNEGPVNNGA